MKQANVIVIGFVALLVASFSFNEPSPAQSIRLAQATGSSRVAVYIRQRQLSGRRPAAAAADQGPPRGRRGIEARKLRDAARTSASRSCGRCSATSRPRSSRGRPRSSSSAVTASKPASNPTSSGRCRFLDRGRSGATGSASKRSWPAPSNAAGAQCGSSSSMRRGEIRSSDVFAACRPGFAPLTAPASARRHLFRGAWPVVNARLGGRTASSSPSC